MLSIKCKELNTLPTRPLFPEVYKPIVAAQQQKPVRIKGALKNSREGVGERLGSNTTKLRN